MQKHTLWGPESRNDTAAPVECSFEDSFAPQNLADTQERDSIEAEDFIPLEDSSQYLAGLERKLARIQGRTTTRRQTESRRLIDALANSRDTHTHQLLNTNHSNDNEIVPSEGEPAHQATTVDPQGALGAMIRRIAPDKVALTHEELCRLLEADFLAKVQEEAVASDEKEVDNHTENGITTPSQTDETIEFDQNEEKKLSSDEGEK